MCSQSDPSRSPPRVAATTAAARALRREMLASQAECRGRACSGRTLLGVSGPANAAGAWWYVFELLWRAWLSDNAPKRTRNRFCHAYGGHNNVKRRQGSQTEPARLDPHPLFPTVMYGHVKGPHVSPQPEPVSSVHRCSPSLGEAESRRALHQSAIRPYTIESWRTERQVAVLHIVPHLANWRSEIPSSSWMGRRRSTPPNERGTGHVGEPAGNTDRAARRASRTRSGHRQRRPRARATPVPPKCLPHT